MSYGTKNDTKVTFGKYSSQYVLTSFDPPMMTMSDLCPHEIRSSLGLDIVPE